MYSVSQRGRSRKRSGIKGKTGVVSANAGISRLGNEDLNVCKSCGKRCGKGFYLLNFIQIIEFFRRTYS
jgi:hypothetical protein